MFTRRHDTRIWDKHLHRILPNLDTGLDATYNRTMLNQSLERVRKLRNRIAHHEPIFSRDLNNDYEQILMLINYRSTDTANWLHQNQTVNSILANKP
jgi:hypothetical protein